MSTRPKLDPLDSAPQFGIVFEDRHGYAPRDWAGPFPSEADALEALGEKIDLEDEEARELGKVVPWGARQRNLAKFLNERHIHPNGDYEFEDVIGILAGEQECGRYGAIRCDETYTTMDVCSSIREAKRSLADAVGQETLNIPEGVIDLDTGRMADMQIKVSVSLSFE